MKSSVVFSYWLIVGDSLTVAVVNDPIKPKRRFLAKTAKRDENVSNDLQNPSLLDFYVQPMLDAPPLVSNDVDVSVSVGSVGPSTSSTMNSEFGISSMTDGHKVSSIPSHVPTASGAIKTNSSFGTLEPTKSATTSPSVATASTSSKPTKSPTESPTDASTTSWPSSSPPTTLPTSSPTFSPITIEPTKSPTAFPTIAPTTSYPTTAMPTTAEPTESSTELPTIAATTSNPTSPTATPTIATTTRNPSTSSPTDSLSEFPTLVLTSIPAIVELSKSPSLPPTETKIAILSSQVGDNPSSAPSETLGGTIWYDANENGIKDDDENGVAGITIQAMSCNGNRLVAFAFSESDGTYRFSNIGPAGACFYLQFPSASDEHNTITVPKGGRTENIILDTNGDALSWNAGIVLSNKTESLGEGEMNSSTTSKPSALTTAEPTFSLSPKPTTSVPTTSFPTSLEPTTNAPSKPATKKPTTSSPATFEPTFSPSSKPTTSVPITSFHTSLEPTTNAPSKPATKKPTTLSPTTSEPTQSPSSKPTRSVPTTSYPTSLDLTSNTSKLATKKPTTSSPATSDPTLSPSSKPTTSVPTMSYPTSLSKLATKRPITLSATSGPTLSPSSKPTTSVPTTSYPTSLEPTTNTPSKLATKKPTTSSTATNAPTHFPSSKPTSSEPTTPSPTFMAPRTSPPVTNSPTHSPSLNLTTSEPITSPPTSLAPTISPSFKPTATSEPSAKISITAKPTESLSIVDNTTNQNSESKPTVPSSSWPEVSQIPSDVPSSKPTSVTNTSNLITTQLTTNPSVMQYTSVPDITTHSDIPSGTAPLYSNGIILSMRPTLNPSRVQASSRSPAIISSSSQTRTSRPSNVPTWSLSEQTPSKTASNPPTVRSRQGSLASTEQETLEGSDTTVIIMTIAGVATLTMLVIVFATQKRRKHEALAGTPTPLNNSSIVPCGTNDNQDRFILSTITGWTDCAQIEIQVDGNDVPIQKSSELQSAAEINCRGTMTLEKEGNSVVPGSWLNALHAGDSREGPSELEASSVDDTSTENFSDSNQGGFPRYIDGAFPTEYAGHISKYLDSSHIGTLDEHDIEQASSQETEESKSSLNRFISDLVWLEQKIADEIAQEATIVAVNEGGRLENELLKSDSYSYECEPYSPRSLSDADSTVESATNSQARSIVCRDCYIPPGILDIEITSTKDGPIISAIRDDSLSGHFKVGDLIMALDDRDTRSLTAKQMDDVLSLRSTFQRKLTLLQFGGVRE